MGSTASTPEVRPLPDDTSKKARSQDRRKLFWLLVALASMLLIFFSGPFSGLTIAGQRVLGILAFALIVWVSEAISYPLSAIAIFSFLTLGLGFAPPS